jgi:16S rRNA (cytosine967-C5)-methyltransferase
VRRGATPERQAAARVLGKQLRSGGHLDELLASEDGALDDRARRQARAILLAATRHRSALAYRLQPYLKAPLHKQDPVVAGILLVGATELVLLDGTPARAAVHQAVELCRSLGQPRRAGFVNAVLRRLSEAGEPEWPKDPVKRAEVKYSHPRWLLAALAERVGKAKAGELASCNNEPAPLYLRARDLDDDLSDLGAEADSRIPGAWHLERVQGGVATLAGWDDGRFWVQDGAAQAAVHLLGLQPGERVLDACAAPGGKAFCEASAVGPEGLVVAVDASSRRLNKLEESQERLGFDQITMRVQDLIEDPLTDEDPFDAVFLDAPCSGLGVLRRHPEIRWNRRPADIGALALRQRALLDSLAPTVRPGGRLVYAVCTITYEETDGVIEAFLADHPEFTLAEPPPGLDASLLDGGALKTDPLHNGLDGFYAVRLDRRSDPC